MYHKILAMDKSQRSKYKSQVVSTTQDSQEDAATITITGVFDGLWFETAKAFETVLNEAVDAGVKNVTVRINSQGGDYFESVQMVSAIHTATEKGVTFHAVSVGQTFSAAAHLFLRAPFQTRSMFQDSVIMVHESATGRYDTAKGLRNVAVLLDKVDDGIISAHASLTGQTREESRTQVEATTWYSSEEALSAGIVTDIVDTVDSQHPSCSSDEVKNFYDDKVPSKILECIARFNSSSESVDFTEEELQFAKAKMSTAVCAVQAST